MEDSVTGESGAKQENIWKSAIPMVAVIIFFVLVSGFEGFLIFFVAVFAFLDAWYSGIRKNEGSSSFVNISTGWWGACIAGLFIIAYPCYFFCRNKLKTVEGTSVYWILTNICGALTLILMINHYAIVITSAS